jgi:mycothiol synthase
MTGTYRWSAGARTTLPGVPVRPLEPEDHADVASILAARAAIDGRPALSEHKTARLFRGSEVELVLETHTVTGYAHAAHHNAARPELAHWALEVAIDPSVRDPVGSAVELIQAARSHVGDEDRLTVWAWRPDDAAAARALDLPDVRTLYGMHRSLPVADGADPPPGIEIRRFRVGVDEEPWLAANNAAFADHPENGALDIANLHVRFHQPWFDPDGFLLAWRGGRLVGSCWTKLHPRRVGEIYIIGVVPEHQGSGLGTVLVHAGLDDLADRQGAREAMLYVDAADQRAVEFYAGLGFRVAFSTHEFLVRTRQLPGPSAYRDQPKG